MNSTKEQVSNQEQQRPKRTPAEWLTFGTATSILLSIIGLVTYTGVKDNQQPPLVSVTTKASYSSDGQYYVPFEITNNGDETAEAVQILAELKIGNQIEEGEQQIDFLSSKEKEEGAFIFSKNPSQGELKIRVASYKLP